MSLFMRVYLRNEALYDALEVVPEEVYSAWENSVSSDPIRRIFTSLIWLGLGLVTAAIFVVPWVMLPSFRPGTVGRFLVVFVPWVLFFAFIFNVHVLRQMVRQRSEIRHARRLGVAW